MALDERARHELFLRLEEALGPESAETLMELLPPVGWADVATKHDLHGLEERLNLRFELLDQRFDSLEQGWDQRFGSLEQGWDQRVGSLEQGWDQRVGSLEQGLDQRFEATEDKLLAAFRAELLSQSNKITDQTKALIWANLGTVVSMATLAFAVAKLT